MKSSEVGGDVVSSYSDYLQDFSRVLTSWKKEDRALVSQLCPFLYKSLSCLEKRLSVLKSDIKALELAEIFFLVYELCLDGLEFLSSQLNKKPLHTCAQRLLMIHYLDTWCLYDKMYNQAFKLFERFRGSQFSSQKSELLPEAKDGEKELAMVVVGVVVFFVRVMAMTPQRDNTGYRKVFLLFEEVRAWFRSVPDCVEPGSASRTRENGSSIDR